MSKDRNGKKVCNIGDLTPEEIQEYFGGRKGLDNILRQIFSPRKAAPSPAAEKVSPEA